MNAIVKLQRRWLIGPLLLISILLLASCGSSTSATLESSATGSGSSSTAASPVGTPESMGTPEAAGTPSLSATPEATGSPVSSIAPQDVKITIGSKLDVDGQLNAEMYALLLENQGFKVTTKLGLGQTPVLDSAIKSGAIESTPSSPARR